jgi:hypothetical protein
MTWAKAKKKQAEEVQAWAGVQPLTVRCALCPWHFTSTADRAREQARAHREQKHPELIARSRGRLRSSYPRMEGPA